MARSCISGRPRRVAPGAAAISKTPAVGSFFTTAISVAWRCTGLHPVARRRLRYRGRISKPHPAVAPITRRYGGSDGVGGFVFPTGQIGCMGLHPVAWRCTRLHRIDATLPPLPQPSPRTEIGRPNPRYSVVKEPLGATGRASRRFVGLCRGSELDRRRPGRRGCVFHPPPASLSKNHLAVCMVLNPRCFDSYAVLGSPPPRAPEACGHDG
jgi:hypothetical protein